MATSTIGSRKLTLRNFRCFDWNHPAELIFDNGFTAIVGPNNSGKSSALRAVYELRPQLASIEQLFSANANFNPSLGYLGAVDAFELANDKNQTKFEYELDISIYGNMFIDSRYIVNKIVVECDLVRSTSKATKIVATNISGSSIALNYAEIVQGGVFLEGSLIKYPTSTELFSFAEIFSFARDLGGSRYFPAFRNAINEGAGNYYDIPVGNAMVQAWNHWKAGPSKKSQRAIMQAEGEIARLLNFKSLQINADNSVKSLNVTIDGMPHKLHEIGAGVAQLIIVLAAAVVASPKYILIDEPELSLHPSLQLNFLATLASYAEFGILFSTHSIGLARSAAERIMVTQKLPDGGATMEPLGEQRINYSEWLGELSYSSRLALGCEGLLLVEGSTDVLFFQEFLRKTKKDHKYVVMQLGGSSLINSKIAPHLTEITRLIDASKIYIFIDSEKKSADEALANDRQLFIEECEKVGVVARASERRATENYFEKKGIAAALGDEYQPLSEYQLLKESVKPWKKADNWKIARHTQFSDIETTDLGRFIASLP
ncbi:hypothetical protein UNDKW_0072 [Undibacterium sp. KW1]|uniref:ATP-dependent nuclease n=1 Tax=Undibacterium sp. KW1 TaxID=2058624 RepID=UPI001331E96D|nr:ATP-binding protein [Undibacterium sp. KW1]BBB58345.1 hypothetical protein UNDKW_0072 [Undibacterium sp. KW1]